jgi:hypothetical protein
MLYISLVFSGILLLLANWIVRRTQHAVVPVVLLAFVFAFGQILLMMFSVALALQAGALGVLVLACCGIWERPRLFLPLSLAGTVLAYGIVAYHVHRELSELRDQFPCISMEERLPPPKQQPDNTVLYDESSLTELENSLYSHDLSDLRREYLRELHEHTVETFVSQPGFGVVRMLGVSKGNLDLSSIGMRSGPPLPQPSARGEAALSTSLEWLGLENADLLDEGRELHQDSILNFVNKRGFGFVKDRRHVAGFQEHGFSEVPAAGSWQLRTLDLVGLVLHDEPVAYVSANLPRMDELREAPTRPLDTFELAGLESIRGGNDLFVRGAPKNARMLGAIRSDKQCVACHGGKRGDLLGAFSYTLTRRSQ